MVPPMASTKPLATARPKPTPLPGGGVERAVEAVEDARRLVRGDAGATVADLDQQGVGAGAGDDLDRRAGRGVAGGVLEEIDQHLLQQDEVGPQQRADRPAVRS